MSEKKEPAKRPAGTASRRRKNLGADESGRQLSRPLLVALLVIVVGGGYLFWPRGGSVPTGIGEQYSVVTADTTHAAAPRSGSVDIDGEQTALVPEQPQAAPDTGTDAPRQAAPVETVEEKVTTPPAARPRPQNPPPPPRRQPAAQPERVVPAASGPWAVQLGAYQSRENADKVVARLAGFGITGQVRAANTSTGEMIHRVWIGWFATREDAQRFAAQEKDRIGEAYPVHR